MAQVETSWHTIKNHLGKFYRAEDSSTAWKVLQTQKGGEKVDGRFQRMICLEVEFYGSGEFDRSRAAIWEDSGASAHVNTIINNTYFQKAVWALFMLDAVWKDGSWLPGLTGPTEQES